MCSGNFHALIHYSYERNNSFKTTSLFWGQNELLCFSCSLSNRTSDKLYIFWWGKYIYLFNESYLRYIIFLIWDSGSHSNNYEDYSLLDMTLCSSVDSSNVLGEHAASISFSTLKMWSAGSSETLLCVYQSTLCHVPENSNLYEIWF